MLEKGTYYIGIAVTDKKAVSADYTVKVDKSTVFFTKGNNNDDTASTKLAATKLAKGYTVSDWVGFGDAKDFKRVTLTSAAKVVFTVKSGDAVKFTVNQIVNGKVKALQTVTVKAGQTLNTKELLLEKGDYYLGMESTNADYSISLKSDSRFFPAATDNNTWKNATPISGDTLSGWVGFGDKADFWKLQSPDAGKLKLDFDEKTLDAAKHNEIKITCLDDKGKSVSLVWNGDTMQSKRRSLPPSATSASLARTKINSTQSTRSQKASWHKSGKIPARWLAPPGFFYIPTTRFCSSQSAGMLVNIRLLALTGRSPVNALWTISGERYSRRSLAKSCFAVIFCFVRRCNKSVTRIGSLANG